MTELPASTLLHPDVLEEPYDLYRTLRTDAPGWEVPGTDVITVSTWRPVTRGAYSQGTWSS